MDIDFKGKRALVTGGGQGIGRETAVKLLQCNANVVALDIDQDALEQLKLQYPQIEIVRADVSDWEGVKKVVEGLGPIDLLVNNAGVLASKQAVGDITEQNLSRTLDINVKSLVNISQVVANGMKARGAQGAIVNLASVAARMPFPGYLPYSVSKAAVVMITQALAVELGPHQIRVNAVSPTIVTNTNMGREAMSGVEAELAYLMIRHPMGRLAEHQQVVEAIVFLLSDRASLIHGANLPVDAGLSVA